MKRVQWYNRRLQTTYKLYATNQYGRTIRSVTVTVH